MAGRTNTAHVPDETLRLLELLVDRTERGWVEWDVGSVDTEFIYARESGSVVVRSVDDDGQHPFTVRFFDPSGRLVEIYASDSYARDEFLGPLLEKLFGLAQRTSVRSSPVVKDMLRSLEDDIPF